MNMINKPSSKLEQRQKWISDAAYYKSIARESMPGLDRLDWLEAEKEYRDEMAKRIKFGLRRIN